MGTRQLKYEKSKERRIYVPFFIAFFSALPYNAPVSFELDTQLYASVGESAYLK